MTTFTNTVTVAEGSTPTLVKQAGIKRYTNAILPGALPMNGGEITDAVRTAATQGDGRAAPDSSYGVWEPTTNLLTNGGFESNTTGWTANSATLTRGATGAKFGAQAGQVATSNLTANEGVSITFTGAAATAYTVSAWVSGSGTVRIALSDSVSGKQASTSLTLTGTPQRITKSATTGAASSGFAVYIETDVQQSTTFRVDGVQVEQKAYATPYVETNGSAASRTLGQPRVPMPRPTPLVIWAAMRVRFGLSYNANSSNIMTLWQWRDGGNTEDIGIFQGGNASSSWKTEHRYTGGSVLSPNVTLAASAGDLATFISQAVSGASGKTGLSINGATFQTTTAVGSTFVNLPNTPTADIGSLGGSRQFNGDYLWFAMGTGTLTDADAATINGWGSTDPTWAQLSALNGGTANPTMVWTADTATYYAPGVTVGKQAGLIRTIAEASATAFAKSVGLVRTTTEASATTLRKGVGLVRGIGAATTPTTPKSVTRLLLLAGSSVAATTKRATLIRATTEGSAATVMRAVGLIRATTEASAITVAKGATVIRTVSATTSATVGKALARALTVAATPAATLTKQVTLWRIAVSATAAMTVKQIRKGIAASVATLISRLLHFFPIPPVRISISDASHAPVSIGDVAHVVVTIQDEV